MAKGFHYFKFIATEWLTGDIFFEDYELQGIFINACAIYWQRDGNLSIHDLKKRIKSDRLNELSDRFIIIKNDCVTIKFLDEQLREAFHISVQNSENGKKGGRPKALKTKEKKPTALFSESETKAEKSQIELELELKENKIKSNTPPLIFPFQSDNFKSMWNRFIEFRKSIKKPLKEISQQAQLLKLSKFSEQVATEMILQSIANGWQGIFELKTSNNNNNNNNQNERTVKYTKIETIGRTSVDSIKRGIDYARQKHFDETGVWLTD